MPYVPVRLDDRLARELDELADAQGVSRSDALRGLLRKGLAATRQTASDKVTPPTDARSTSPRTR
jgi:metal-responsive CopG/Arc/MetJ family transcriptional regulator